MKPLCALAVALGCNPHAPPSSPVAEYWSPLTRLSCDERSTEARNGSIENVQGSDFPTSDVDEDALAEMRLLLEWLYWDRAECMRNRGDPTAVADHRVSLLLCRQVLNKQPDFRPDDVNFCVGTSYVRLGRVDEGRVFIARLCEQDPYDGLCVDGKRIIEEMAAENGVP